MKALRFELEIPYWCSFGDFSSLNIKLSYPCPPLPTLFGLIQNALGKESLHNIDDKNLNNALKKQYIEDFKKLKFSVIINDAGELIEDYVNIHKGNRNKERVEEDLKMELNEFIKKQPYESEIKKHISKIKKHDFYIFLKKESKNVEYEEIFNEIIEFNSDIIDFIKHFWDKFNKTITEYNINKIWISTQINRQRLINPHYTVYIISEDESELSLENLLLSLKNPKRPLYLGESDDVVDIINLSIVEINYNETSLINSILPGLYSNSNLVKIPTNLKFDSENEFFTLCSIPNGELEKTVECYEHDGENFVFL